MKRKIMNHNSQIMKTINNKFSVLVQVREIYQTTLAIEVGMMKHFNSE
jgi:hypothetical protein